MRSLSVFVAAASLGFCATAGAEPKATQRPRRYLDVSKDDIRRVVATYLVAQRRTVVEVEGGERR